MSIRKEFVQIEIDVNTQKGVRQVAKLQQELKENNDELDILRKKTDVAAKALEKFGRIATSSTKDPVVNAARNNYAAADTAYREQLKTVEQTTFALDKEIKSLGLAALTRRELNKTIGEAKRLERELIPGTEEYAKALQRVVDLENERTKRGSFKQKEGGGFFDSLKNQFPSAVAGAFGGIFVGGVSTLIGGITSALSSAVSKTAEFGKELSKLAAITGLDFKKDAEDLRYYANSAHEVALEFGIASTDILRAFQRVGSIKPELLKAKEQLVAVTRDAITLSKASGDLLTVEDAAKAVVGSLNQFDEQANQSTRYINVLAAGAKEGSAEIQDVAESFKKAGVVLKANNITFEQSNALVQILASKMIVGEQAGTNLRNIFTRLLTGAKETNPAIVGLNTALENLSKLSPAELAKRFGEENIVAARTIVEMRGKVDTLTKSITGTNEAVEQQHKNMDNLSGDLDKLSASWNGFFTAGSEKSNSFFRTITQGLTATVKGFSNFFNNIEFDPRKGVLAGGFHYNSDATKAQELAQENAKKRQELLQKGNQFGKESIDYWTQNVKGATESEKQIRGVSKALEVSRDQFGKINQEVAKLGRATDYESTQKRKQLLEDRAIAGAKVIYTREELSRFLKNEKDREKIVKDIDEGEKRKAAEEAEKNKSKLDAATQKRLEAKRHEIDELARLTFEADQATATEQNSKIQKVEHDAEQELTKLNRNLEDGNISRQTAAKQETLIHQRLKAEIDKINQEYDQKRLDQLHEQQQKAVEIATATELASKQSALRKAEKQGDTLGVYNAKVGINDFEQAAALQKLDENHLKEAQKLNGNEAAITQLRQNHQAERANILAHYLGIEEKLWDDFYTQQKQRVAQDNIESLRLKVSGKDQKGGDSFAEKKNLLLAEKDLELSAVGLTEDAKANIREEYRQKEKQLETEHFKGIAEKAIGYFNQGFGALINVMKAGVQNAMAEEDNRYNTQIRNLDNQKAKGELNETQLTNRKTALAKKHDEETRKLKKKQFEIDKAANIASIISETALSIMKVSATIWQIPIVAALGAVQLGIALSAPYPEFAEGGEIETATQTLPFKKPTNSAQLIWTNETGQSEYITPAWQYRDPALANLYPVLEYRRQNKISGEPLFSEPTPTAIIPSQAPATNNSGMELAAKMMQEAVQLFAQASQNIQANVIIGHKEVQDIEKVRDENKRTQSSSFAPTNTQNLLRN